MRLWITAAVLACSTAAHAATVIKCTDAAGKVTFAQNECPGATTGAEIEVKAAQRPSGDGEAVQLADPNKRPAPVKPKPQRRVVQQAPAEIVSEEPKVVVQQQKPCVKYVEQRYNYTKKDASGRLVGVSGIKKVPVPCNQR